jgi:hypothetical protein
VNHTDDGKRRNGKLQLTAEGLGDFWLVSRALCTTFWLEGSWACEGESRTLVWEAATWALVHPGPQLNGTRPSKESQRISLPQRDALAWQAVKWELVTRVKGCVSVRLMVMVVFDKTAQFPT